MRTGLARVAMLLLALACAAAVAACGDDDDGGGGGGGSGPTTLKVGVIPIADVAPLYLGMQEGLLQGASSSRSSRSWPRAARRSRPPCVSGDFQIGFSNTISLLIAASQEPAGADHQPRACWAARPRRRPGPTCSCSRTGRSRSRRTSRARRSPSTRSNNVCEVTIKASLEKEGVDVDTLKFAEVPFPDMNAALEAGRVDARLRGRAVREPGQGRQGDAGSTRSTSARRLT